MDAVRHGMTSRQIASRLGVEVGTVKYHVANALQKLGLPNRRALRRWAGVPRHSALAARAATAAAEGTATGMATQGPLGEGRIGQVSRTVRNVQESEAFYGQVLGLRHLYTYGDLAFFDVGGSRLYLQQSETPQAHESLLYFRVDDIQLAHARLTERGVGFRAAPHMIHRHQDGSEEWMAFFDDPEGRPLAIMALVPPKAAEPQSPA